MPRLPIAPDWIETLKRDIMPAPDCLHRNHMELKLGRQRQRPGRRSSQSHHTGIETQWLNHNSSRLRPIAPYWNWNSQICQWIAQYHSNRTYGIATSGNNQGLLPASLPIAPYWNETYNAADWTLILMFLPIAPYWNETLYLPGNMTRATAPNSHQLKWNGGSGVTSFTIENSQSHHTGIETRSCETATTGELPSHILNWNSLSNSVIIIYETPIAHTGLKRATFTFISTRISPIAPYWNETPWLLIIHPSFFSQSHQTELKRIICFCHNSFSSNRTYWNWTRPKPEKKFTNCSTRTILDWNYYDFGPGQRYELQTPHTELNGLESLVKSQNSLQSHHTEMKQRT